MRQNASIERTTVFTLMRSAHPLAGCLTVWPETGAVTILGLRSPAMTEDARRHVPRTDTLLADPRLAEAGQRLGRGLVKDVVQTVQQRVRDGEVAPLDAVDAVLTRLPGTASSLRPVLNATGVLVHTNLGRAPLSPAAVEAVVAASGTTDVELDLSSGRRGPRGEGAIAALLAAVPAAEAALVVNNCAAAL